MERHEAHATVSKSVGMTLSLYDANLSIIDTAAADLRKSLLTAYGTERSAGLQEMAEGAFAQFRVSLNASEGGVPLFAGSRTEAGPFIPNNLAATLGMAPATAFGNDTIRPSARVAEGQDVEFGIVASDIGPDLFMAFRTLAEAGPIGETPTPAQKAAMKQAADLLESGLKSLREVSAENGRKQQQVETLGKRAVDRTLLLKELISDNEDADLGEVAVQLSQQQTALQASYSIMAQLSKLRLGDYLR
jgi:flagellar hook-associated protein 3 FlgL